MHVGNLSFDTTEDTLRAAFQEAGEIVSLRLPVFEDSGKPRGFCMIGTGRGDVLFLFMLCYVMSFMHPWECVLCFDAFECRIMSVYALSSE